MLLIIFGNKMTMNCFLSHVNGLVQRINMSLCYKQILRLQEMTTRFNIQRIIINSKSSTNNTIVLRRTIKLNSTQNGHLQTSLKTLCTHMDIWLGLAWHKKPIGQIFIQSISLEYPSWKDLMEKERKFDQEVENQLSKSVKGSSIKLVLVLLKTRSMFCRHPLTQLQKAFTKVLTAMIKKSLAK